MCSPGLYQYVLSRALEELEELDSTFAMMGEKCTGRNRDTRTAKALDLLLEAKRLIKEELVDVKAGERNE